MPDPPPASPSNGPAPNTPSTPAGGPEEPRGRTRRRLIVTWALIGLFAGAFAWGVGTASSLFAPAADAPDPAEHPDLGLELTGKVLVGARSLLESLAASESDRERLEEQFEKEFDTLARPLDEIAALDDPERRANERATRLRAIMISADFVGAEEATSELDALLADPEASETLRADGSIVRRAFAADAGALSDEERERLIDHHGWVGRLTTTFDLPGTDDRRTEILSGARTAFVALFVVAALAGLGMMIGLVAFAIGIVLISKGKIRARYEPDRRSSPTVNAAYLQVMAIFLGAFVALKIAGEVLGALSLGEVAEGVIGVLLLGAQWLLLLAALWPLARGERLAGLRRGLGWHCGRGLFREIGAGVVAYLAGLPVVAIGFMITLGLIVLFGFKPSHPIQDEARQAGIVGAVLLFALAVVWAPLVEETMFRGAMYHSLRRWAGPVVSALVVAFLFAAIHPQGVSTIPVLMALAMVFAAIREWRGSLIGSMTAHAMHNGVLVALNLVLLS